MLAFKIFTLFPELFPGPLGVSVVGRALQEKRWTLEAVDLRCYALDKHRRVDDTAFGGGPGMVLRPDVIDRALKAYYDQKSASLIYLSPRGQPLCQQRIKELAKMNEIGLLCGRFEGVDQRLLEAWLFEEISIGDFILSGGELPAMMLIDACVRLLPEVLGSKESLEEESFSQGLLEYSHYTRPQIWEGREVPAVLLSGHHKKIKAWRQDMAEEMTRERRPDLWRSYIEQRGRKG